MTATLVAISDDVTTEADTTTGWVRVIDGDTEVDRIGYDADDDPERADTNMRAAIADSDFELIGDLVATGDNRGLTGTARDLTAA